MQPVDEVEVKIASAMPTKISELTDDVGVAKSAEVSQAIANVVAIIPPAQVEADYTETNTTKKSYIKNKPVKVANNMAVRAVNTSFVIDSVKDSLVVYSIEISVTVSLTTGKVCTAYLESSADGVTWATIASVKTDIAAGLSILTKNTYTLIGIILKGQSVRIRTTGTGTVTYVSGQEAFL